MRVAQLCVRQLHHRKKLSEKGQHIAFEHKLSVLRVGTYVRSANLSDQLTQVLGSVTLFQHGAFGHAGAENARQLGHGVGIGNYEIVLLKVHRVVAMDLVGEGDENVARLQTVFNRVHEKRRGSLLENAEFYMIMQVRTAMKLASGLFVSANAIIVLGLGLVSGYLT